MAKVINCGRLVRGETDDEVVATAEAHIGRDRPDLAGKISRDGLLATAEEA